MPRVNIYIRNEDYPKWQIISDRPKWIHEKLNPGSVYELGSSLDVAVAKELKEPKITPPEDSA